MMKRIIFLLIAMAMAAGFIASADEAQKREMRAAWVATVYRIDWPTSVNNASAQKAELDSYLNRLQTQNFNAIFLQVRTMCDAFYQSSYEPWSSYLTGTRGKDPGYDPLAYAVEQCHARGIQCHAWINPYRWSTGTNWSTPQDQALQESGMLLSYNDGSTTYTVLNPGLPETRERIVNVIREIITNYDVDGIIFDDYFYPNGIPSNRNAGDYTLWQQSGSGMTIGNWRRANVNQMVADVYNMIQETKPEVRFGIGPAGVAGTANTSAAAHNVTPCPTGSDWQYNGIFSDPLAWLEQGTIDYISPQLYWKTNHSTNPFGPLTEWWSYVANHFGRHHYASHSISFLASSSNTTSDWAEVTQQINYSRQYTENNAPGAVLYSAKNINGNNGGVSGLGNYLFNNAFQHPAMIPAVTWKTAPNYSAPTGLAQDGPTLTWTAQEGTLVKYSVYAVPADMTEESAMSTAFDGIMSDYLLGVTYTPSFTLPSEYQSGYWYAVCTIDGYGNESEPAYLGNEEDPNQPTPVTYNIEKVWEITNLNFLTTANTRQGFGMGGKYYVNDKGTATILEIDQNGLTGTTYEGGVNVGFTRDEAGNFVVSNALFPEPWGDSPEIKVINPNTGEVVTYTLPTDVTDFGRSDLLGFARGNLLENGEFFIVGANSGSSISRITITDGELDTDNTYLANCDGVSASTGTVINPYIDLDGEQVLLYVNRSSSVKKLTASGDNFEATSISLPDKGNCNGAFPFIWDGKELVVYPTVNNYRDGFAVAEINAAAPLAYVQQTATADANSFQADWLNAEVIDKRNVTIYQYYPGGHLTVWRLTKRGGILRGDVNDDREVTISDVTMLIDYILFGVAPGINLENAECDLNETIDVADVTALIDFLLNGFWPE